MNLYFQRSYFIFLLLLFNGLMSFIPLQASDQRPLAASEVIAILEQRHGISIFYRNDWFGDRFYPPEIVEKELSEALHELISGLQMQIISLDGMLFLMPLEESESMATVRYGDEVTIGNPNEFGRYARATISGVISDGETDEPLIGAVLYESTTGRGTSTDTNGWYAIDLPVGDQEIRVTYIGYEDRHQRIRLIASGQLNMELYTASTQLEEVTVVARRLEENVTRTQMSMIMLDARAIRELPASYGEPDIIRSLTLLPGVQTVGEFGTGFNVRGGSADQNLILMEQVPVFNTSHLFGLVSVVNPDLVNSVTLIKAGTPARYGERASSVMDIRLGEGLNMEQLSWKGSIGVLNSRILFESPIVRNKATIAVAARTSHSDMYLKRMPSEDLMNSSAGFHDLTALANLALNGNNTMAIFGYRSFDRFSFGGETNHAYSNTLGSLRWNSVFSPAMTSSMVLGTSHYRLETRDEPVLHPDQHFIMNSAITYQSLKWHVNYLPGNRHHLGFGIQAIAYGIEPGQIQPFGADAVIRPETMEHEQALELAAYLSDDLIISERLSLELGLRFSQYLQLGPATLYQYEENKPRTVQNTTDSIIYSDRDIIARYHGLEPRFGMRWLSGPHSSVKVSFARIHQYINLISNTAVAGPTDAWKLSDQHLKPLRSDQFAIGYFQNFFDNTMEVSFEGYYKHLTNAIDHLSGAEIAMNRQLETSVINVEGYNYGTEVYLRKPAGRINGWASYTWSVSRLRSTSPFPETQINRNQAFPSNFDRPHNLVLNMNYQLSRRWRFGATFTYNTGRPVTLPELEYRHGQDRILYFSDRNKYRLPDYHRLDLSISLDENLRINRRGKGSFTFSVMNAYGRRNPHTVFYRKEADSHFTAANYKLYQLYIIARPLPTLSYTFHF